MSSSMFAAAVPGGTAEAGRPQTPPPLGGVGNGGRGTGTVGGGTGVFVGVGGGSVTITRMSLFSLYIRERSSPKYHSIRPWKVDDPASFALLVKITARWAPEATW